jgi:acetyl esterase
MFPEFARPIESRFRIGGLAFCLVILSPIISAAQTQTQAPPVMPSVEQTETDPQVKAVVDRMAAAGVLHPMTVEEVRAAYAFYQTLSGTPEKIFHVADRSISGPAGEIPIRIYSPNSSTNLPILVFFHSGGFVAGNLDSEDTPLRAVTNRCGCIVVSVDYRLAPKNPYPAAPEDAFAATKWVSEHAAEFGGDAQRIAVGGDGSGGNLAAVVTLMARDKKGPRLIYQVLIYPDIDAILRTSRFRSHDPVVTVESHMTSLDAYVLPSDSLEDPYVSPIYAKTMRGLPPALIITDEDDPARDEGGAYASRLRYEGVPIQLVQYPNVIHGFFLMAGALDAGKKCIDQIGAALTQAFKNGSRVSPADAAPH